MSNLQMVFALLIPTITVLAGIIVSNGRFNSVDARFNMVETRLGCIESDIAAVRERLAKLER